MEEFVYKVDVEFIIDKSGALTQQKFTDINNSELSDFQKRILKTLSIPQKWKPGTVNGSPINTRMRLVFHLSPNR